jgi:hypothetical protein
MKKILIPLVIIVVIIVAIYLTLGYFLGNLPVASKLLGTNKPKDLGVNISIAEAQSGLKALGNPVTAADVRSIVDNPTIYTSVQTSLSDDQVSSLFATADMPNFPFKLTQLKFGNNGSVQCSGIVKTAELQAFLGELGISGNNLQQVMNIVRNTDSFTYYIDGVCSVTNNRIDLDINSFKAGNISLPEDIVSNNLTSASSYISNALVSKGYNIRKLTISEGKVDLDMDRPLGSIEPWLNFIQN